MNKYIFFIDADNTLVKRNGNKIDDKTLCQMQKMKKSGHIFVLATGRALPSINRIKGVTVFDFYAALFGSLIIDSKSKAIVYRGRTFDKNSISSLVDYLQTNKIEWEYKCEDGQKTISQNEDYLNKTVATKVSWQELENDIKENKIFQLLVNGRIDNKVTNNKNFNFFYMPEDYSDVSLKGVDKSQILLYFRKIYPNYKFVAIGDSENDLPMFKVADMSIAMGNAIEKVKKQATFITKPFDKDGLLYAFKEILEI